MIEPMEFSDQMKLIYGVKAIRDLLDAPTKLTPKELRALRSIAQRIVDACNFNIGWHAAAPERKLSGYGATEKLFGDIQTVTDFLLLHAKPRKRAKPGRPAHQIDDSYAAVIVDHIWGTRRNLPACVRTAAEKGIIDANTKDPTHIRRIERYFDLVRKKFADLPSDNVVKFPKGPRTKFKK